MTATILLVEDDPGDQELTRRALADAGIHHDLRVVEDGEEALQYLMRQGVYDNPMSAPTPQLVLLDLNLPRIDGKKVLQRIRERPDLRRLPVVVLTTSLQEEDVAQIYELGANSYIAKPVDLSAFVDVLRSLTHYWFETVVLPRV